MMQFTYLWSSVCAVIISYWITWLLSRSPGVAQRRGWAATVAVHSAAALVFFAALGLFKSYGMLFAWRPALIALPAQLVWLLVDASVGGFMRQRRPADGRGQGTSARRA
jgi:hypothetical protein